VASLQRRQPEGAVVLGVGLAADAEEAAIEQADGACEEPLAP
jgi:hypothetical protein